MIAFALLSIGANAQYKLVKDSLFVFNGLEFRYSITNKESKEDYERYEIRFFVRNLGSTQYIPRNTNSLLNVNSTLSSINNAEIAKFSCINATGKRLTNKSKTLYANRQWEYRVTQNISKELAGKILQLGNIFLRGEIIYGTEIILTPKGELPIIEVSPIQISEIMN